jgi:bifunctional UDP-N-acetylglucosamine pyrophosphorylase / glucosamine-1-phosphate N-acetyltransferase
MTQQIVILAAGKGTRMGSEIPKVLLPLYEQPVISHLLDEIKQVPQSTEPILVVGYKQELVKKTLGDQYIYVTQFDQKGTAHAVLSCRDVVTADNFVVLYGDMPFTSKESLQKLIQLHNDKQAKVSMFTCTVPNFEEDQYKAFIGYGRIIRDEEGNLEKIVEYKDCTDEQKQILEVNPGIYMFNTKWVWDRLDKIGNSNAQDEFYLTDVVEIAIHDGQTIYSTSITAEEAYGINTPEHLQYARSLTNK